MQGGRTAALALLFAAVAATAAAHDNHHHGPAAAPPAVPLEPAGRQDRLPIDIVIDKSFRLIDQHGQARGLELFHGTASLVFFGYANCDGVCLTGVPAIAQAAQALAAEGLAVRPVLVTIDPANDTPEALARALAGLHPDYLGLTGSEAALAQARRLFHIEATPTGTTRDGETAFQHGTFV